MCIVIEFLLMSFFYIVGFFGFFVIVFLGVLLFFIFGIVIVVLLVIIFVGDFGLLVVGSKLFINLLVFVEFSFMMF